MSYQKLLMMQKWTDWRTGPTRYTLLQLPKGVMPDNNYLTQLMMDSIALNY